MCREQEKEQGQGQGSRTLALWPPRSDQQPTDSSRWVAPAAPLFLSPSVRASLDHAVTSCRRKGAALTPASRRDSAPPPRPVPLQQVCAAMPEPGAGLGAGDAEAPVKQACATVAEGRVGAVRGIVADLYTALTRGVQRIDELERLMAALDACKKELGEQKVEQAAENEMLANMLLPGKHLMPEGVQPQHQALLSAARPLELEADLAQQQNT